MLALVTGSTGFIGSHLCRALLEKGWSVRAFHRPSSPFNLIEDLDVERVEGDLNRPESLLPAVEGAAVIFHCAAAMSSRTRQRSQLYITTVEGTRYILQAARISGVQRVIYTSAAAALGIPERSPICEPSPGFLLNENHTWNGVPNIWPFGYSKYQAELEVQRATAKGLDVVTVNPTQVIGPGDLHRQTRSLVVQVAARKLPFLIHIGINIVPVADVVAGHLAALEHGQRGARYILGGHNLTLADYATRIAAAAGVEPPAITLSNGLAQRLPVLLRIINRFVRSPFDPSQLRLSGRCLYYSNDRAQSNLHLDAPRPLDTAINESLEWFRQAGAI
jgi:dihydroflavonol-4-reductase